MDPIKSESQEILRITGPLFPDTDQPDLEHMIVRVVHHGNEFFIEVDRETEYHPFGAGMDPDYGLLFLDTELEKAEKIANAILEAVKLIRERKNTT
ncbi:MAG: hypothetical protein ACP5N7_05410 [Candidatus Pacearchaeota archaeon]